MSSLERDHLYANKKDVHKVVQYKKKTLNTCVYVCACVGVCKYMCKSRASEIKLRAVRNR